MRADYRIEPCRSALNRVKGMGFGWSLNPYMGCAHRCAFCYVRGFEKRADRPSDERYGSSVRIKSNIAGVLRAELASASWKREEVVIGAATDPYQPIEGRFRLTRSCLVELAAARTPYGIITRGPLISRDIDVLQEGSRRAKVGVSFSVPTLDEQVWRVMEPGTAPPRARLKALERLVKAGVRATVGMAPILPGLSDDAEKLSAVVRAARDAGACGVWVGVLNLRPGTREHFMEVLAREWPQELARYESIYATRAYPPRSLTQPIGDRVDALKREFGIADRRELRWVPPEDPVQMAFPGMG
jgi:DNA repair photolyase